MLYFYTFTFLKIGSFRSNLKLGFTTILALKALSDKFLANILLLIYKKKVTPTSFRRDLKFLEPK